MHKRVNFEDNIFIIAARIRVIRDLLILDTDPELFLEKTMDDIAFVDHTLDMLLGNLMANERLMDRNETFENLADLESQFSQVLSILQSGSGNISAANFPLIREKIQMLYNRGQERQKTIGENRETEEDAVLDGAVSSDELSELLRDF
ncbi:MAG: hypothetical protein LBH26_04890 [Treponema sp.]|jgi:uncharacterized iron-regulated protein|nr:hypothetical protein [Treponema sp.]